MWFYGWWIVFSGFVVAFYTAGIVMFGFTAVFEPIVHEFHWSYTEVSLAASLRGFETGIFAPITGILADRWGPRSLMLGGSVIVGIGLIFLSQIHSLLMFYMAFALISLGMSACSNTVLSAAIANWFRKKVGLAAGILGSGNACSGLVIPVVVILIDIFQWRTAMVILGIGTIVICAPLSLLVRHKPEPYGYLPDGEKAPIEMVNSKGSKPEPDRDGFNIKEAIKSRAFWHISLALLLQMMILNSVITHVMPYLTSVGIARSLSAVVASSIALVSIFGRLGVGFLDKKFGMKRLSVISFASMSLGLFFFGCVSSEKIWLLVPFSILFSIGYGGNFTMSIALLAQYFGRSHFGGIIGFTRGVMMVGVIVGAPLAGWIYDTSGNYGPAWFIFSVLCLGAMILMVTVSKPKQAHSAL